MHISQATPPKKRGPLTVGIDLDGTVIDYIAAVRNAAAVLHVPYGDDTKPHTYTMTPTPFNNSDDWLKCHTYAMDHIDENPLLDQGFAAGVDKIRSLGHRVLVVTARDDYTRADTEKLIDGFGVKPDQFINAKKKTGLGLDIIYEDNDDHIRAAISDNTLPVRRPQLYNHAITGSYEAMSVTEIADWLEAAAEPVKQGSSTSVPPAGRYLVHSDGETIAYQVRAGRKKGSREVHRVDPETGKSMGKVSSPRLLSRAVAAINADPSGAMADYGRATGSCGRCGRTLSDPISQAVGLGPGCRSK